MDQYLTFWNLMCYDFAGGWAQPAAHQANLYPSHTNPAATPFAASTAIDYYTSHGVDPGKIVLGMPLYGRVFAGTDGPGKPYRDIGTGGSWETGIWDFKALPLPGAQEEYDGANPGDGCGASWSYDTSQKIMTTYDTVPMVKAKAQYVKGRGLGGGMWWESSADRPQNQGSAVQGFNDEMASMGLAMRQVQNCLDYPESKYDNIKNKMGG